jgi:SAM-dependent methyltransferase
MEWVFAASCALIFLFGFVVVFGAPYLPTLRRQIDTALDLLDLQPGQTMLELGCGDGRVMRAAAARGWKVVGYELNPILVAVSYIYTFKYRKQVRVVWGNALTADWPPTEGIYIFGLQKIMPKLHTKIVQYRHKPVKLVSFTFEIPGKQPSRVKEGVRLYKYLQTK